MKKILILFLMSFTLSACATVPQWKKLPTAGTITADTKIAYIADNKSFDNLILIGLRERGLTLVKKFDPQASIADDYKYILAVNVLLSAGRYSSYFGTVLNFTFILKDKTDVPIGEFSLDCDTKAGDTACLNKALDTFTKTVLAPAAPEQR